MRRAARLGLLIAAVSLGAASPASGIFRFDEIDRRDFEYNEDYFVNVYSYRPRLTHRWRWRMTSVGYSITAGSVRNDELYVDQRARIRLPLSNHFTGEYRFVEWEDYDARYARNEVELVLRFFRPDDAPPLLADPGHIPPPDGLFVGGQGLIDADKEFADLGYLVGYRDERFGVRLDLWTPDFFFNGKNDLFAEYETAPLTFRALVEGRFGEGDLEVAAWVSRDFPLKLTFAPPSRQGLVFRYDQLRAGLEVRWQVAHGLRFDLVAWGELTDKTRRSVVAPDINQDVDREAFQIYAQAEKDVPALLGDAASRPVDVLFGGLFAHVLDEETDALNVAEDITIRRGEVYAELGYVLSIPSPGDAYAFGVRASTQLGYLGERDVREEDGRHRVNERFMGKAGIGFEAGFLDDLCFAFGQFTLRLDTLTFGGGNVQVLLRF